MIRRLFWLTLGAGLGISGYRRVTRILRGLAPAGAPGSRGRARLRGVAGFARDVRDGMGLYAERQRPQAGAGHRQAGGGPTLGWQQVNPPGAPGAGTALGAGRNGSSGGTP